MNHWKIWLAAVATVVHAGLLTAGVYAASWYWNVGRLRIVHEWVLEATDLVVVSASPVLIIALIVGVIPWWFMANSR